MPVSVFPTGTTIYDPEKAWNGYTLFSAGGPAKIIDMNGNTVNSWQGLGGHPAKMLPNGDVMGSKTGRRIGVRYAKNGDSSDLIQVDWDGNIVWEFNQYELVEVPGGEPVWRARQHHDYQREGNSVGYYVPGMDALVDRGNTLLLCHKNVHNPAISDVPLLDCTIIDVTWDGKIIWEWICSDHIEEIGFSEEARATIARNPNITGPADIPANLEFPPIQYQPERSDDQVGDWVHMNAISYLGPNKWYDMGDERFHPENIICDGRQTNHIAIIDKKTGKLVWQVGPEYTATEALRNLGQIIGQHQAHMIPRGLPGEGNILVYDNGGRAGYGAPNPGAPTGLGYTRRDYTRVLEFDPTTLEIVWQYTPVEAGFPGYQHGSQFYSVSISGMQRLPNGNTLICEGQRARLLEVTREHETVWEYVAPDTGDSPAGGPVTIYRASRVPYDWAPGGDRPDERAILRVDNARFRVPGSPRRKVGRVTRVKTGRNQ